MRFFICMLLVAIPGIARRNDRPEIEVIIPPMNGYLTDLALVRAQRVVSDIYSEIGLTVAWRSPRTQITSCTEEPHHRTILIALSRRPPVGLYPSAMAVSNLHSVEGACVTLFVDRLKPMAEHNPDTTSALLGYVLAHEIGHVLQGIARHSETGLLKPHWSQIDIETMRGQALKFTPDDVRMILEGFGRSPDVKLASRADVPEAR